MYLALSNLQSMQDFKFPCSLHALREAISTGWDVLHCASCPSRWISAMHNVQLLSLLCLSIVERYSKILQSIEMEAQRAKAANESINFHMATLSSSTTHLHTTENFQACLGGYSVDLAPLEWQRLAKKVVKAEMMGTCDRCCPCFLSLVQGLERRQGEWHASPPIWDLPKVYWGSQCRTEGESPCLRLVLESKRIAKSLEWG